ncbi:zinc finger-containing ubiquitin peptidase 1-like [Daktulosphaira vitifoliae]|uniref:zinc finger-containing ubiquitin peptidase 1-like n=1 Tax=Daktulosphaira vitifoliae TaxID=58002 RepID=UPI0021A99EBF|nr:zinc finger-containing ubiquitin peptidase 1-like [Daktulosphaira vitifoliae]
MSTMNVFNLITLLFLTHDSIIESILNDVPIYDSPQVKIISQYIHIFSKISVNVKDVYMASATDFYKVDEYSTNGCAFKSLQMLMSSLMLNNEYSEHLSKIWEHLYKMPLTRSQLPSMILLQNHLERCWDMGIDNSNVYRDRETRRVDGIYVRDVLTMLYGLRLNVNEVTFDDNQLKQEELYQKLLNWLHQYFKNLNDNKENFVCPVLLFYQNDTSAHAAIVVGVEILLDDTIVPLVLSSDKIELNNLSLINGMDLLNKVIRPYENDFKSCTVYQVLYINGINNDENLNTISVDYTP